MDIPQEQIEEMKGLFKNISSCSEGKYIYFFMPDLQLPEGCVPEKIDALLCPMSRDGYDSRLFFAERIKSCNSPNWNANGIRIIERNWHAFSWKVPPNLRLTQMLAAHLRGLQ
ncbi:MAG: hypothetical protein WCW53_03795 [Syntrophales bacterium]|jgi:hypothetical protein